MPLYEWECECGHKESVWTSIALRDVFQPEHDCGKSIKRLPGGHGLLYFEEGRGRSRVGLSDRPITSKRQHEQMMKKAGAVECGDYIPKKIRDNPQNPKMKELAAGTPKGRWI